MATRIPLDDIPDDLPGSELVKAGLAALARGELTAEALLLTCARTRLAESGIELPGPQVQDPDRELYLRLESEDYYGAHARYTSLRRRLVSFLDAYERRRWASPAAAPPPQ